MHSIGVRALRENPGILSQAAADDELVLVTNRGKPMMLAMPVTDDLLRSGALVNAAARFFEDGLLPLGKSAAMARMPVESFIEHLGSMGIVVVDQSREELEADLRLLEEKHQEVCQS